ncbi:MAG: hypothetical protein JXK16_00710 [Thiotrichales bacterium]|nr:hypothetical protein [Thiotrichales bacterium]
MSPQNNISHSLIRQLFFKPVLILLALAVIAAGAWYILTEEQKSFQKVENQKVRALNGLISQVNFLRMQVKLYAEYGDKYKELVRQGVVKQQDRVFWVDSMVQMQQSLVMPEFNFSFTPEASLTSERFEKIPIAPRPIFFFSRLTVKMGLQHEGDLLTFINAMNTRVSPMYLVESCKTEFQVKEVEKAESMNFNPDKGNIRAECSFIVFHSHAQLVI